jgi:hypothetical protein
MEEGADFLIASHRRRLRKFAEVAGQWYFKIVAL